MTQDKAPLPSDSLADMKSLQRILDVRVQLSVELGRRKIPISEVLSLEPGTTLEFSKNTSEPLDIRINDQLVARGEAIVMGERYGVRITEVVNPNQRLRSTGMVVEESA